MRKFATNILVRNNRLAIMKKNGLSVNYEILSNNDYLIELKNKLLEESKELIEAKTPKELKEEIIDVMEVLEHLIDFYSFDTNELTKIKNDKQIKYGKFDKKIKTHYVEMPDNHEELTYYLSKPNKYPEIK